MACGDRIVLGDWARRFPLFVLLPLVFACFSSLAVWADERAAGNPHTVLVAAGKGDKSRGARSEILTNAGIIRMIQAGISESIILQKIRTSENRFDLSADGIARLKKAGASDSIIRAMQGGYEPPPRQVSADASPAALKGRFGVGVWGGSWGYSSEGVSGVYFPTDSVFVQGLYGMFGGLTTYAIRGAWIPSTSLPIRPYGGGGYAAAELKVTNLLGSFTSEGSGAQLFGGALVGIGKNNLKISVEGSYNLFDTEYKAGDKTWKSQDWSRLGGMVGITYLF